MCREGAWAELTVEVTFVVGVRREAHGFKLYKTDGSGRTGHGTSVGRELFRPGIVLSKK